MKHLFLSLAAFFLLSCSNTNPPKTESVSETSVAVAIEENNVSLEEISSTEPIDPKFISSKGVESIRKGMTLAEIQVKYDVRKEMVLDNEGNEMPIYLVDEGIVQLETKYDWDKNEYNDIVREINIESDKYETSKGIKVGSTISDFVKAYPNAIVWYTYISQRAMLKSKDKAINGIQFEIDMDYFTNIDVDLMAEDGVELKINDFKDNTPITRIRIF